jgi:hypothetical protein
MKYIIFFIFFTSKFLYSQDNIKYVWIGQSYNNGLRYSLIKDSLIIEEFQLKTELDSLMPDSIKGRFVRLYQTYYKVDKNKIELEVPLRGKVILDMQKNKIYTFDKVDRVKTRIKSDYNNTDSTKMNLDWENADITGFTLDPSYLYNLPKFDEGRAASRNDYLLLETTSKFTIEFENLQRRGYVIGNGYSVYYSGRHKSYDELPCHVLIQDTEHFKKYIFIDNKSCLPLGIINMGKDENEISYIYIFKGLQVER